MGVEQLPLKGDGHLNKKAESLDTVSILKVRTT